MAPGWFHLWQLLPSHVSKAAMTCEFNFPVFCLFPIWVTGMQMLTNAAPLAHLPCLVGFHFHPSALKNTHESVLPHVSKCSQCSVLLVCFDPHWVDSVLMPGVSPAVHLQPFPCDWPFSFPQPLILHKHSLSAIHWSSGTPLATSCKLNWHSIHISQRGRI